MQTQCGYQRPTIFSKKTKCCTFKPIVPNYLVGGIIQDDTQNQTLGTYIDNNTNIFPLGYFPTSDDLHYYETKVLPDKFGIDDSYSCDFYMDGNCGIWKYRNAICSTYFCHYFKGFTGKLFWDDVRDFIQFVEDSVSQYCCYELGIPVDYIKNNTTNFFINVRKAKWVLATKSTLSDDDIWGEWLHKKRQFFIECHALASQLTLDQLIALNPTKYNIQLNALQKSYDYMISDSIQIR